MFLRQIFDPFLAQYAYLIGCQKTGEALVIDPLRDIDGYVKLAEDNDLRIVAVAETHIHADFVSGAQEFAVDPEVRLFLSDEGGTDWRYQWPKERSAVTFLHDGDRFSVGNIQITAVHTPGHTPEHLSFLIHDFGGGADEPMALVSGDFLFVGDVGRPDLLESAAGVQGSMRPAAEKLGESLRTKLGTMREYLQVLPAHGAGSACGKSLGAVPVSTLGYERRTNHALRLATETPDGFVDYILTGQPEPPPYFARMKRVNRDGIHVTRGLPAVPRLSAPEFVASSGGGRIVDASASREDFCGHHFPKSLFAPLRSPYFSVLAGSYIEPEDAVFLVLQEEGDLECARRQLYRIGYDRLGGWISRSELGEAGLLTSQLERRDFHAVDAAALAHRGCLLDVRTTAEFQDGHIAGARHIPYTRLKLRLGELECSPQQPLYVHCGSGKRAALAASFLQSAGYPVTYIDGVCEECERIAEAQGVLS